MAKGHRFNSLTDAEDKMCIAWVTPALIGGSHQYNHRMESNIRVCGWLEARSPFGLSAWHVHSNS